MTPLHLLLSLAALLALEAARGAETTTVAAELSPGCIELRDQFDSEQKLCFPSPTVTLLAIADKKGSEQIAGWVQPVRRQFGERVDIRGVADVSSVPGPLRGLVRKRFQRLQNYPVMMDWSGNVSRTLAYVPGQVNILLLDQQGRLLSRWAGDATEASVREICEHIQKMLKR